MADTDRQTGGEVLERTKQETKRPELFKVLLLNDDYTTMDFVVEMLETIFNKQPAEAFRIMMMVHTQGKGLCGVYPLEIAETKVETVVDDARASTAFRCGPRWNRNTESSHSKSSSTMFSHRTRNRSDRRLPRGDVAAAHAPDARAPALRAGARPGRRAHPRRVRRRSAAAAHATSTST